MAGIDWRIEGISYGSCNCAYGCPCQFEADPTHGHCRGFEALQVERGHFGDVVLDGLRSVLIYAWPGPIYEAHGTMQAIIDARATPDQRAALLKILSGEETEPGATHWWVFHSTMDTIAEPLFLPIEFADDVDARTAAVTVPGVLRSVAEPIRSPVSGEEHRVRIDLPKGIEFRQAEIGSGKTEATGIITLALDRTYAQFNRIRQTPRGIP